MMVLITYDVETITSAGRKRLRKVAKECKNYGQRVQNSVFECNIDPALFAALKYRLVNIIDKEKDSLRFYFLGNNWQKRVDHEGRETAFDIEGTLIV
ncbi:MAG: CRISPR-associated endonuclease Cas2 [Prolixibacteraceae bacterium]|nr:CRISPR-associated endonuclease Cas2 [Prolixibacteraceae bacterium]